MPEPSAGESAAGRALANEWENRLASGASADEIESSVFAAPRDAAAAGLRHIASSQAPRKVDLIERVAMAPNKDLAIAATEALGTIRDAQAAEALDRISRGSAEKAVQKSARRSLYRLSSQGIRVTVAEQPAAQGPAAARTATLYRVVASAFDGSGTRAMWFGADRPLGGIYMIAATVNDVEGLTDVYGRDTTRKRFAEQEAKMRETDPMAWVELPFDYAKQLIAEAVARTRDEHLLVPNSYAMWAALIDSPDTPLEQPIVYREISAIEARLHPTLEGETPRLFEQPEIEPWFAPPSAALKWAHQMADTMTARLIVTLESDTERQERILREAVKDLFPPRVIRGLRRRLEETAYIFLRTGREPDARRAVAAAVTIEDVRPLQPLHPFLRAMAMRSLQIAYEAERSGVEPSRLALSPRG
jgi:hypothetical protein